MNKVISIIIPTYNMEKYLCKCLNSLVVSEENMQRLEVLVINDGSKDSSSKIAHEYEKKYPQTFRVIDKENGNYGSCINRGLKEANGKYIKVLDADDFFDNNSLSLFIEFLEQTDADLIINNFSKVTPEGAISQKYIFNLPIKTSFSLNGLLDYKTYSRLFHHGITYKTSNVRSINYVQTEGISYTDDEWIFKPMIAVKEISYFPQILYMYLRGREGQTFDPKVLNRSFNQRIIVAKSMIDFYESNYKNCSREVQHFLDLRLYSKLSPIYSFYIYSDTTDEGSKTLESFDMWLKDNSPSLYSKLGTHKNSLGVHIIKRWRNAKCRVNNDWFLVLLHLVYKSYNFIKQI